MKLPTARPRWCLWRFPSSPTLPAVLLVALCFSSTAAVPDGTFSATGAWTNLTFGSYGDAKFEVKVAGTNALINFDLGGYVFGLPDPPATNVPALVQGSQILVNSKGVGVYGDIQGVLDLGTGAVAFTLTNVLRPDIRLVTLTGTLLNGMLQAQYTVDFYGTPSPFNPAVGVVVATQSPAFGITYFARQGTNLVLRWTGGKPPYEVRLRTNLQSGTWSTVGASTTNTTATIPLPAGACGYFRVSGQP